MGEVPPHGFLCAGSAWRIHLSEENTGLKRYVRGRNRLQVEIGQQAGSSVVKIGKATHTQDLFNSLPKRNGLPQLSGQLLQDAALHLHRRKVRLEYAFGRNAAHIPLGNTQATLNSIYHPSDLSKFGINNFALAPLPQQSPCEKFSQSLVDRLYNANKDAGFKDGRGAVKLGVASTRLSLM